MAIRSEADFNDLEAVWRERLAGRSLVVEGDVEPLLAIEALGVLGSNLANSPGRRRANLFERFPAVLTTGLCAVASSHYDAGTFWPNVPPGLRVDANRQTETGKAFQRALTRMGLSRFTTPHPYLGEILMHGGVPLSSIGDLVRTLVRWDESHTSGDGEGFVRWTSSMSQALAVTRGFDVPTWRFLTQGGEIAEDFVDRVLHAIDSGSATAGLPAAIADAVAAELERNDRRRARTNRGFADVTPLLTYSPHHGVRVRLPPIEHVTESDVSWSVLVGGESTILSVPAPWPGDPVGAKWVPIREPQQAVTVTVSPGSQQWLLPLIDGSDPLLVFDGKSGALVPERTSLPQGPVWLAFPAESSQAPESQVEAVGTLSVIERGATPHGWPGWAFVAVDAAKFEKLRLVSVADRWRYVTTVQRPRFADTSAAHPYMTTVTGDVILRERPQLLLPGPRGGIGEIDWTVIITATGGEEQSRFTQAVSQAVEEITVWPDDAPLLGDFLVTVRGPLGRGAALRVAVAESIEVSASTNFRWMSQDGSGLEQATITVSGVDLNPLRPIRLGATQRQGGLTISRGDDALAVIGQIPHLAVGFVNKEGDGEKIVPLLIDIEGLQAAVLRTRVPVGSGRVVVSAVLGREVLQTLEGNGGWGSPVRTFNLAALSGTLAARPSAELRLVTEGASAPIAFIRPRRLATAISVDPGGLLRIEGKADVDGLVAHIYPEFARWRPPARVEIPSGEIEVLLDGQIRREGRAVVVLTVDNPWVQSVPPKRPDRSNVNAFTVKVGTLVDSEDPAERGFRRWLAGMAACPSTLEALPIALRLYSLIGLEEDPETADRMRTEIAEAVRGNRARVLPSILESSADLEDLLRLLVESDVVTVPREDWESSSELWALAPGLGVIADSDEIYSDLSASFLAHLESAVGSEALAILDSGTDPAARVGKFNEQTRVLAKMPSEQFEAIWRDAALVPKALLDPDSRALASRQLLQARADRGILVLRDLTDTLLDLAQGALSTDLGRQALEPIAARVFRKGMGDIPAVSIALALVARAAARGKPQSARLYAHVRDGFAKLAAAAPKIVHQDLALAELWLTRWEDVA